MSDRYYCINCDREFDEYKEVYEPDGLDTPPYRYTPVCPYCKSDDFYKILGECACCGDIICEGNRYYELDDNYNTLYCESCITERR